MTQINQTQLQLPLDSVLTPLPNYTGSVSEFSAKPTLIFSLKRDGSNADFSKLSEKVTSNSSDLAQLLIKATFEKVEFIKPLKGVDKGTYDLKVYLDPETPLGVSLGFTNGHNTALRIHDLHGKDEGVRFIAAPQQITDKKKLINSEFLQTLFIQEPNLVLTTLSHMMSEQFRIARTSSRYAGEITIAKDIMPNIKRWLNNNPELVSTSLAWAVNQTNIGYQDLNQIFKKRDYLSNVSVKPVKSIDQVTENLAKLRQIAQLDFLVLDAQRDLYVTRKIASGIQTVAAIMMDSEKATHFRDIFNNLSADRHSQTSDHLLDGYKLETAWKEFKKLSN